MNGKVVFITGSAQGLGLAYARHLAGLGAKVVVADLNEAGAQDAAAAITASGGTALAVEMDVTDEASVAAAFVQAVAEFGPVEVLINNAGGHTGRAPIEEVTLAAWDKTVALSLTSAWLCARAVIPGMKAKKAGRIINVVSSTVDRGLPLNMTAYVAAKGGVAALTRGLARELGPYGITANAISPGLFVMDRGERMAAIAAEIQAQQSLPQAGVPEDLIGAVAFLASDAASFITGQVLNVDGGWSLK